MGNEAMVGIEWIIISSVIGSGLLSVIISILYYRKHEKYLMKLNTLKDFAGYRFDIDQPPFFKAVNEITIVFSDSKEVKDAVRVLHDDVQHSKSSTIRTDLLVRLYKAMCKDLNIKTEDFTDQFFLRPFSKGPKP